MRSRPRRLALALVAVVAVGVRALNVPELYRERVYAPSSDPYHYRAAFDADLDLAAESDRGMHLLLEALAWVPIEVLTWLPVGVGLVTTGVVAWTGRELADERVGLAAALLVAVAPAHALYSSVGMLDHHAADHLLVALALAGGVRALDDRRWLAVVGGVALVAVGIWEGSLVTTVAPVAAGLAAAGASRLDRGYFRRVGPVAVALAGVAVVVSVALPDLAGYLSERAVDDLLGRSRTVESRGLLTPSALANGVPVVFGGVTLVAGVAGFVTTLQSRVPAWRFVAVTAGVCVALAGLQTRFLGAASVPLALAGAHWVVATRDRWDLERVDAALALLVVAGVGVAVAASLVGTAGVSDDRAAAAAWLADHTDDDPAIAARIETSRTYHFHSGAGLRHGGGDAWRRALRGDVPDGVDWVVVDGPVPPGYEPDWHAGVASVAFERGSVAIYRVRGQEPTTRKNQSGSRSSSASTASGRVMSVSSTVQTVRQATVNRPIACKPNDVATVAGAAHARRSTSATVTTSKPASQPGPAARSQTSVSRREQYNSVRAVVAAVSAYPPAMTAAPLTATNPSQN